MASSNTSILICPHCRSEVPFDQRECPACGNKVNPMEALTKREWKAKRMRKIRSVLSVVLLVIFAPVIVVVSLDYNFARSYLARYESNNLSLEALEQKVNRSRFPFLLRKQIVLNSFYNKALETDRLEDYGNVLAFTDDFSEKGRWARKAIAEALQSDGIKPDSEGRFTDYRNNLVFPWLQFGSQIWMAEDYKNGEFLSLSEAVNNAPEGWRVPNQNDWETLEYHFGNPLGLTDLHSNLFRYILGVQLGSPGYSSFNARGKYWSNADGSSGRVSFCQISEEHYSKQITRDNTSGIKVRYVTNLTKNQLAGVEARVKRQILLEQQAARERAEREAREAQAARERAEREAQAASRIVWYEVYDTYRDTQDPYLNLRARPDPSAPIIRKLRDGERVEVLQTGLGPNHRWYKVKYHFRNETGYVHSRYIRRVY